MQQTTEQIQIGSLGILNLNLPKITFKTGIEGPNIVLIAGQHGREITPFFVLQKVVASLRQNPLTRGSLIIIPGANPLGLLFGNRFEPFDGEDLNRIAPGNDQKNLSKRIAAAIFTESKKADLVIDLHTFSRECLFTGVLIKGGGAVEEKSRQALKIICPDCIWQIDLNRQEDKHFAGGLDLVLVQQGIPAISVEMKQHLLASDEDINRVANSLLQLLTEYKMTKDGPATLPTKPIPVFVGTYLYFDQSGLFIPRQKVAAQVKEGEILGELFDLSTFKETAVTSRASGTILTLLSRDFVRTGSKLGSIGKQIDVL